MSYAKAMTSKSRYQKEKVIKALGGNRAAATYFGITPQAISQWPKGQDIPRLHQLELRINKPNEYPL